MSNENQNINNSNGKRSEKDFGLENIRKDNPFKVPADYFESLPDIISERKMKVETGKLKSTTFLLQKVRPAYYIAAVLIILIATTMFIFKSQLFTNSNNALAELSWEEVANDNYFIYTDIDVYSLIETLVYTTDDIAITNSINLSGEEYPAENDSNLSSDDIIEYLIDENIDTEEIYEL